MGKSLQDKGYLAHLYRAGQFSYKADLSWVVLAFQQRMEAVAAW